MRFVAFLDRHLIRLITAGLVGLCCWLVAAAVVVAGCGPVDGDCGGEVSCEGTEP